MPITVKEAYKTIAKYISYYNEQRYQERLNEMSPIQYFQWMVA